jgi:TonB-dependent starch-binding outer membrane protein SusC
MKKTLLLILGLLFFMGFSESLAQSRKITGKVTSVEDGSALPGVTVQVKSTTRGTQTDANGAFSIEAASNETLVFTFIGMTPSEISVGNKSIINVTLSNDDQQLEQLVVIGYGTEKRANTTGSLTSIKGDKISGLITPNFANQLGGRAAGVQVSVPNGLLGQAPRIRIRGTNSISSGAGPLIVIDNVPVATNPYGGVGPSDPLSDINPNDIESFEVLKDGAATAIFGSRAANGVILITTKKGKGNKGKMAVNYDVNFGQNQAVSKLDLLNAADFITIANEKYTNAGQPIQAVADGKGTDTDWQDVIFRKGMVQSHNLSLNGANDKTNYFFSLGMLNNEGSIVSNNMKRYNFRANLDHTVNKWLTLGTNLSYTNSQFTNLNTGSNALSGNVIGAARLLPNVSPFDETNTLFEGYNVTPDGAALGRGANLRAVDNNFTNIAFVLANNKFVTNNNRLIGNAYGEITIIEGLKLRSQIATDLLTQDDFQSLDSRHGDGRGANGTIFHRFRPVQLWNWQNTASYNKAFGKHSVNVVAGLEYQKRTSRFFDAQGQGFSEIFFQENNLISGSFGTQLSGGGFIQDAFDSYFGRVNYNYASKYYLSLTARNDGLSSLPLANRRGTFPGGSVAYRISEEGFWKDSKLAEYISDFRVKASYAVVGNTNIGFFPYLGTFGAAQYASQTGIAFDNTGNPDLKWEKSTKTNFGIDLGVLNNRIKIGADYFTNKVSDLVLFAPTANSLGVPGNGINKNVGAMVNKGIELSIDASVLKKGSFEWDMNVNFSKINNEITALNNNEDIIGTYHINRVGYSIGSFFGYTSAGVNPANGNPMWYKGDGKGNLTSTIVQYNIAGNNYREFNPAEPSDVSKASTLSATTDRTILGNSNPLWLGGWSNNFRFKGFDFEIFSRFQGGNMVMNVTKQETLLNMGFQNNGQIIMDRWTTAGQVTEIPRVWTGREAAINTTGAASTRFLEKGDFFRIQNIILGYRLPASVLTKIEKAGIRSLRVYAQIQNPLIFTKYSGLDPEISTNTGNSDFGVDANANPIIKTTSIGINLGL